MFDKQNKNAKWADAIAKEMKGLKRLSVFIFKPPNFMLKSFMGGNMHKCT